MIIHFSASARNVEDDIHKYRQIINCVRSLGHSLSHDWVETALLMTQKKGKYRKGWNLKDIILEAEAGIEAAELVIVEATGVSTFGVGYELALALQKKKAALVLIEKSDLDRSYASALTHPLVSVKSYRDEKDIKKAVEIFINENTVKTKDLRFNFVVDRKMFNYLRNQSFKQGKTKAEIVRDLLLRDMGQEK